MTEIIAIKFKKDGRVYYFDPDGIELNKGDSAIVETARGVEFGEVVLSNKEVTEEEIVAPLKKVLRKATEEDFKTMEEN